MIVVSDTSATTSRLQIGWGEGVSKRYGEVYIPEAVRDELPVPHPRLPVFLRVRKLGDRGCYQQLLMVVDQEEAEAIALAKEINADEILIDEADGRRVAIQAGLKIIGMLGVLLEAKKRGLRAGESGSTDCWPVGKQCSFSC